MAGTGLPPMTSRCVATAQTLERLGRPAHRVAADDTNCVSARGQQRVDDAASLSTRATDNRNDLLGHVVALIGVRVFAMEPPAHPAQRAPWRASSAPS
jgi:hypothetical protein